MNKMQRVGAAAAVQDRRRRLEHYDALERLLQRQQFQLRPASLGDKCQERWSIAVYSLVPTYLDNINTNVLNAGIYLFHNECRRHMMDVGHAQRVLGSQGGRGCHCIAAMGSYHLLVGFQTPAKRV